MFFFCKKKMHGSFRVVMIRLCFGRRHERSEGAGERADVARVGAEGTAAVHAVALSGRAVQIRRAPPQDTRTGAHLSGKSAPTFLCHHRSSFEECGVDWVSQAIWNLT